MGSGGSLRGFGGLFSGISGKGANASTGISPDFQAGGGERADVYEPTQAEVGASMQADRPQYIPGSAYAAAFDPAYQALTPYAQAYLNQFNMPNTAQMLGGNQNIERSLEEKLAAAGQNRVTAPDTSVGQQPSSPDYSNIRPDMLLDPRAAGWELYSSNIKTNPYSMFTGTGGVSGAMARIFNPAPAGSYTDAQGNVWVRKT
jgi:hypothetical protein